MKYKRIIITLAGPIVDKMDDEKFKEAAYEMAENRFGEDNLIEIEVKELKKERVEAHDELKEPQSFYSKSYDNKETI